jgi:DNA gyrase subunit A
VECSNLDKLCIFTKEGNLHQLKLSDVPMGKLRDKGAPVDNLCNFDSSKESIVTILPLKELSGTWLLFVTEKAMMKMVEADEFVVSKRTTAATKLGEGDKVLEIAHFPAMAYTGEDTIVLKSREGYFLRFPMEQVSVKKKGAVGVRGMRLLEEDEVQAVYFPEKMEQPVIEYKEKELDLKRLKLAARDGKGTKVRR